MAELTLETLARRIEALERIVAGFTLQSVFRPGTGNWDVAAKAISELEDYDYDAHREQRELDLKHAEDHLR